MTATQLPLSLAQRHRNQQLFSDYYLDSILPSRPEWKLLADDVRPLVAHVREVLAAYTPPGSEAQLEDDLVKPILRLLGHTFEIQAALRTADGVKKPDYIFYRDAAALQANKGVSPLTEAHLAPGMIAVGDAKRWDRNLDMAVKEGTDALSNKNPAYQIAFYMQQSGATWGILTNGRLWRLYHKDSAHRLDRFYEMDLVALAEAGDAEAFLYFAAFFGRKAFNDGPLGLAEILRASTDYARAVGESLKAQVYDALRHLAQGFLDYPANRLGTDPATLKQIYDNSLIVLYRLLFVLYAEARELLPVRESSDYLEEYSLKSLSREIARRVAAGTKLLPTTSRLWPRLRDLFGIIHAGSPPLKVATFNGGLFDPARHPFLEQNSVGDAHLQQALDRLARVDGQFIDYKDLAERHLGTIYEGLLEYHLEPIEREGEWSVAIVNDKGERHRTGSYYTPDFVVQYIVDQTLGPVLRCAVEGKTTDAQKVQAVLEVNCCDPAMGSGHFPVAATEYIARFLVDLALPAGPDGQGEADLAYWKRRVVQSCIYGVDLNPLAVELAKLSLWLSTVAKDRPLSFLDHHLRCGNALVGGRVAELGSGAPKPKKSKKTQPATDTGQLSMLSDPAFAGAMGAAVGSMWLIEDTHGNTIDEVRQQEQLYATVRAELTNRYKTLADIATAAELGVAIEPALWRPLAEYEAKREGGAFATPAYEKPLAEVRALAAEQRFFHWDLEFPEVFFDRHGRPLGDNAGFNAVIGNPPYVRQEQLGPLKGYFQAAYAETYHGVADLYVYFYHQGLRLLQNGGRMSYIVTNKWLRAGYGEPLRAYFAASGALEQIVDFGHAPIFPEADVFPCIVVLEKPDVQEELPPEREVLVTSFPREALKLVQLDGYVQRYSHRVPATRFGKAAWSLEASDVDDLMAKIKRVGVPLAEFAGVKPLRGVLSGLTEAFVVDKATVERLLSQDPRSAEVIAPYLRGQDMNRWEADWRQLWLVVLMSSGDYPWPWKNAGEDAEAVFQQTYPALHAHLKPFEAKLRARQDKGRFWWELRSCAYYDAFARPKIFYPDITWRSQFSLDVQGRFSNNTVYFLPTDSPWLLTVLNSPLMWSFCWREAVHGKDEALRFFSDFVERIPIAPPTDEQRAEAAPAVARLIAITKADQETRRDTLDWLRTEYGVEAPGQKLEDFAALDEAAFVEEVRKRRPKALGTLTPAGLKGLRGGYAEQATPVRERKAEALTLERRLAALVNAAYGLTPKDVELLWRTAPPRMPVGQGD
jgi:hypothetical protein